MKLYTDYNNPSNGNNAVLVFVYRGAHYWFEDNKLYYVNRSDYKRGLEWTEL